MAKRQSAPRTAYTRTRVRDNMLSIVTGQEWAKDTSCAATSWFYNGVQWSLHTGVHETMTDLVIPGFRKLVKQGKVFFNPMSKRYLSVTPSGGNGWDITTVSSVGCVTTGAKPKYQSRGDTLSYYIPTATYLGTKIVPWVPDISDYDRVVNLQREVATKVRNARGRTDANLWESLAELDRTVEMLNRPIGKTRDWLRSADHAIASGRFGPHMAKAVANAWLAYRYGVRPIMSDYQAILDGMKETIGSRRLTTRAKGSFQTTKRTEVFVRKGISDVTLGYDQEQMVFVRGMSLDDVELSRLNAVGFTSKGLATLPWELTPYSFVADWFANIGDFIGASIPSPGWNEVGNAMTTETIVVTTISIKSFVNNSPSTYVFNSIPSGTIEVESRFKGRMSLPAAGIVIRDDFRFDKLTRASDALALLSQQIMRVFDPTRSPKHLFR